MKISSTFRNITKASQASARESLQGLVKRHLQPALEEFNPGQLRLHATLERRKQDYRVTLRLHLPPRKLLVAQTADELLTSALRRAVDELARQAEKHQAHVSGQAQWRRKGRRQRLKALKARLGVPTGSQPALPSETSLASLLPRLEPYIRQELTYLRATGDLPEDYPTLGDLRDEMFIRIEACWDEIDHDERTIHQTALKTIHAILEEEVARAREGEAALSMESRVPEDAEQQAEEMVGEEINEFYQPDQELLVEDLIPDSDIETPEQAAEAQAVDVCYELLGQLPTGWRRALTLVYRERIPQEEVASGILDMEQAELQRTLQLAEAFIHAHLGERGLPCLPLPRLLAPPLP